MKANEAGLPIEKEDFEYLEHRVFSQYKPDLIDFDIDRPHLREDGDEYSWTAYENDMRFYPEIFKMYSENHDRYEKMKAKFQNDKPGQQMPEDNMAKQMPRDDSPWTKRYDDFRPRHTGESFQ